MSDISEDTIKRLIASVMLASISSFAYCTDYLNPAICSFSVKLLITFVLLCSLYYFTLGKIDTMDVGLMILSLITSVIWALCLSFIMYGGFTEVFGDSSNIIKTAIFIQGSFVFIYLFLSFLEYLCRLDSVESEKRDKFFTFFNVFILMILVWLPIVVISYPGEISYDAYDQIYQGLGMKAITSHHPVIASYFYAGIIAGSYQLFGSGNIGLFSIILIQLIIFSAIIAYGTTTMVNCLKVPSWIGFFSILYPIVVPYYISYICCVIKDVLFSAGMMLLCIELIVFAFDTESFFAGYKHFVLLLCASILSVVFRHNGRYILCVVLLFMVVYLCASKRDDIIRKIGYIAIPILACSVLAVSLPIVMHVQKGETGEVLCMPLQELARTAKYTPQYFSDEDKMKISQCIDFDELAASYNPICVDRTKDIVNANNPTSKEIADMLGVWVRLITRHPEIPVLTSLGEFHICFYPFKTNTLNDTNHSYDWLNMREEYNITYPEALQSLREGFQIWLGKYNEFPVITLLSGLGFDNMVLLGLIYFSAKRKQFLSFLIPALPALLTGIFILLGPCIIYNQRYGFPIMFTIPFLIGTCSAVCHRSKEEIQHTS